MFAYLIFTARRGICYRLVSVCLCLSVTSGRSTRWLNIWLRTCKFRPVCDVHRFSFIDDFTRFTCKRNQIRRADHRHTKVNITNNWYLFIWQTIPNFFGNFRKTFLLLNFRKIYNINNAARLHSIWTGLFNCYKCNISISRPISDMLQLFIPRSGSTSKIGAKAAKDNR